jgi:hypothetical protein
VTNSNTLPSLGATINIKIIWQRVEVGGNIELADHIFVVREFMCWGYFCVNFTGVEIPILPLL